MLIVSKYTETRMKQSQYLKWIESRPTIIVLHKGIKEKKRKEKKRKEKKRKEKKRKEKKRKEKKRKEKKRKLDMLPSQTAYPAGFETSTPDWPQFPCLSRKCDASVWITWIHLVT